MSERSTPVRIKALAVPEHPAPHEVGPRGLTLGRAEDNDVVLPAASYPSVSAHHARLEVVDGRPFVEDQGSRNGTFVNESLVTRTALEPGDVVRLGPIGPRFVVLAEHDLLQTAFVDPERIGLTRPRGVSEARVEELVEQRAHRNLVRAIGVLVGLLVLALGVAGLLTQRARRSANLQAHARALEMAETQRLLASLEAVTNERELEYEREQVVRAEHELTLRGELDSVLRDRALLQSRIADLESARETSAKRDELESLRAELAGTRTHLEEARRRVELLDPINLEQVRLSDVARVRESVVLLEVALTLLDADGTALHVESTSAGPRPNFEGLGRLWALESTGSGFCVSPEGWILTNAHVVSPPENDPVLASIRGLPITTDLNVSAVFSDTDRRIPARVERIADGSDLALLKIEPFEGMSHLADFDTSAAPPSPGSDVFLFGFPLGTFALQEGERVIASTFRGILSREVDGILQVDAGVHPGNSGGPITDAHGRVVGVVFSVQATPEQTAVYTIGYGLPIERASELWPLRLAPVSEPQPPSVEAAPTPEK